ncbi:HNH endonuclease signature motif containing protein [Hymenobacter sp. ASUV-10]|uniref:HNH endonuclease signature motif containing protein n=1 Tax=Hymenobacter aranciens TaxID=3063996 RepID=A0ABT9B9K7_9BACT|nr:HNH endonuclease signature motif containing protein [Hymenobacter sp. ASUV-10]MDO7874951.1 HNH endonuclease signature motif containing protein [Hymenobacter sp. ASUV-10]
MKKRLLKAGLKEARCEEYQLIAWRRQPIALELHHRNGINNDHRLENLQLLCPNCHAQTNSYRGENQSDRSSVNALARVV